MTHIAGAGGGEKEGRGGRGHSVASSQLPVAVETERGSGHANRLVP